MKREDSIVLEAWPTSLLGRSASPPQGRSSWGLALDLASVLAKVLAGTLDLQSTPPLLVMLPASWYAILC